MLTHKYLIAGLLGVMSLVSLVNNCLWVAAPAAIGSIVMSISVITDLTKKK